ncbi:unnamed protein product [Absidia cylindrospora]
MKSTSSGPKGLPTIVRNSAVAALWKKYNGIRRLSRHVFWNHFKMVTSSTDKQPHHPNIMINDYNTGSNSLEMATSSTDEQPQLPNIVINDYSTGSNNGVVYGGMHVEANSVEIYSTNKFYLIGSSPTTNDRQQQSQQEYLQQHHHHSKRILQPRISGWHVTALSLMIKDDSWDRGIGWDRASMFCPWDGGMGWDRDGISASLLMMRIFR